MKDKESKITAYHEGGHALVAAAMNHTDPVTKVTILPRGRALGYTMVMPTEDKYSTTRNEMLDQLAYALGGRVAEELVFHDPTTGAGNDIEKATAMARKMVTAVRHERAGRGHQARPEPGRGLPRPRHGAPARLLRGRRRRRSTRRSAASSRRAHDEAWDVLVENRDVLDRLVLELLEKETLERRGARRDVPAGHEAPLRPTWLSSETRFLSDQPPVLTPAERAAANGGAQVADGNRATADAIDEAARGRGDPPEGTRPPVVEVPESGHGRPRLALRPRSTPSSARDRSTSRAPRLPSASCCIAVGEDPDREGLRDTPGRVARAYAEIFAGLRMDPADVLTTTFDLGHDELVLVRDIEVYSTCEHHLVPFHGVAHVGYIPANDGRMTGLSKLARLVDVFARRPQVQERLTTQIADALVEHLQPRGRHRRRRVRAPVHVHARGPQAGARDRSPRRSAASCATPPPGPRR